MNATALEPFDSIELPPLTCRLKMLANGYEPIPLIGKRPLQSDWPNILIDEEAVRSSATLGANTGMRTARAPVLDIDIRDEEVSHLIEEFARKQFGGRGKILVRIGDAPKRAIPLRTLAPFKKIIVALVPPYDLPPLEKHPKIEVLGDGQQVAVAGIHPDTGKPYRWRDGLSPVSTPLDELPLVDETEMRAFVDACVSALIERGWRVAGGADRPEPEVVPFIPLGERLEKTEYQGDYGINDGILAMTANLIASGVSVKNVEEKTLQWVRGVWAKMPDDHPDKAGWDWNAQRSQIADACYGFIKKECGNQPRIVDSLPDPMLKKWRDIEARGGAPFVRKRKYWGVEDSGPAEEIPVVEVPSIAPEPNQKEKSEERKLRFRLIKFQDMRPGIEPTYLVDELMPSAGLVLIWGKQKTFKSFWLLDLLVHVAMNWPYRDHAVRQGAVVYCAFEGGHGYKGRIEAIRRHYNIADDVDVPLYVMPGQVDLIADEKTLVDEFRYQLGGVVPAVVVLDTLNRSLSGSESSDKDMTLYVKAADAVRKAFGCVCVIVHHCGYDDSHARGHTSLPAAVDAELSVQREETSPIVQVTVKAMRDGPEGMVVRSRALPVPLDPDQNGKPRSSLVIVPDDDTSVVIPTKKGGRHDTATPLLVEALRAALGTKGEYFTPDGKLPLQAVDEQHVREIFYRRYIDAEEDKKKSHGAQIHAFKRGLENAVGRQIANGQKDDQGRQMLWFVRDEGLQV